jgi:hypothetical protein
MRVVAASVTSIGVPLILPINDLKSARVWSKDWLARAHLDIVRLIILEGLFVGTVFGSELLYYGIHIHLYTIN